MTGDGAKGCWSVQRIRRAETVMHDDEDGAAAWVEVSDTSRD